jgi:Tfp pilus assembly protein PilN
VAEFLNQNQIDFLPAAYREVSSKRKVSLWRLLVVALFGATIVGTALYQVHLNRDAELQLAGVENQYQGAMAETGRLAETQAKLQPIRATAELLTYLRHPWPRTQILTAVVTPLPEEITLSELHIFREKVQPSVVKEETARPGAEGAAAEKLPPAAIDLQKLREEFDNSRVVVSITGLTQDPAALHVYLAKLNRNHLFTKVTLGTIEASHDADRPGDKFSARLIVRPGYGQPGGPEPKSEQPPAASALTSVVGGTP